jgi:hypothetical protein
MKDRSELMSIIPVVKRPAFWGLCLSVLIPSIGVCQKYLGVKGVFVYLLAGVIGLLVIAVYEDPLFNLLNEDRARVLAILTAIAMLIIFLIVYPMANSGKFGGGSDTDEAITLAATNLLYGKYPYYARTYLGNPIDPLPGAILLSIPFVLLRNEGYQNLFWMILGCLALKFYFKSWKQALILSWIIVAFSPRLMGLYVTGNDDIANTLYILLSMTLLITLVARYDSKELYRILATTFVGICFSSRANFLFLLPILLVSLMKHVGWKRALAYLTIAGLGFMAVTMPFFLYDPVGFTPFHTMHKLSRFNQVVPYADIIITVLTLGAAVVLSWKWTNGSISALLRNCSIVLAIPVLFSFVIPSLKVLHLKNAGYGIFCLLFAAPYFWHRLKFGDADNQTDQIIQRPQS